MNNGHRRIAQDQRSREVGRETARAGQSPAVQGSRVRREVGQGCREAA